MALEVPWDVPRTPFARAGLIAIDGDIFEGRRTIGTRALFHEIDFVKRNLAIDNPWRTKAELEQVRNIVVLWCFSHRTLADNQAVTSLLAHAGLYAAEPNRDGPLLILDMIETRHRAAPEGSISSADWISARPPPQRLPSASNNVLSNTRNRRPSSVGLSPSQISPSVFFGVASSPISPSLSLNSNPRFQGKYNFSEHKQEYDGYQFQCVFRCLKDGKHCRKAPVREMNRHLRERHGFRPGFKIAGVDWERKCWRGAGADHEECIGKLVEKDSPDVQGTDKSDGESSL